MYFTFTHCALMKYFFARAQCIKMKKMQRFEKGNSSPTDEMIYISISRLKFTLIFIAKMYVYLKKCILIQKVAKSLYISHTVYSTITK